MTDRENINPELAWLFAAMQSAAFMLVIAKRGKMSIILQKASLSNAFSAATSAFTVLSIEMQMECYNIANISTANFLPRKTLLADDAKGNGVILQGIFKDVPNSSLMPDKANRPQETENRDITNLSPSGTNLAKEIPHMILCEKFFSANAKTINTLEALVGTIINVKG